MEDGYPRVHPGFDDVTREFHNQYCLTGWQTWTKTYWLGVQLLKCPLDLWIYQEILFQTKPDLIIETGTWQGGSAYFLASMFDLLGSDGRIVTVDKEEQPDRPQHPRITYLTGSSIEPAIVEQVRDAVQPGDRVMVLLDSSHAMRHVLEEMKLYGPLVTPGCYLVVEDTNIEYWKPEWEPGPMRAVEAFFAEDSTTFTLDMSKEKFFMSFNPGGYLLRNGG